MAIAGLSRSVPRRCSRRRRARRRKAPVLASRWSPWTSSCEEGHDDRDGARGRPEWLRSGIAGDLCRSLSGVRAAAASGWCRVHAAPAVVVDQPVPRRPRRVDAARCVLVAADAPVGAGAARCRSAGAHGDALVGRGRDPARDGVERMAARDREDARRAHARRRSVRLHGDVRARAAGACGDPDPRARRDSRRRSPALGDRVDPLGRRRTRRERSAGAGRRGDVGVLRATRRSAPAGADGRRARDPRGQWASARTSPQRRDAALDRRKRADRTPARQRISRGREHAGTARTGVRRGARLREHGAWDGEDALRPPRSVLPAALDAFVWIQRLGGSSRTVLHLVIASALLFSCGFATHLSGVVLLVCLIAVLGRNPFVAYGADVFGCAVLLLLLCSPSDAALSVDRLISDGSLGLDAQAPPWGGQLLRGEVAFMYLGNFLAKLRSPAWRRGTVMFDLLSNRNFARPCVPRWLLRAERTPGRE